MSVITIASPVTFRDELPDKTDVLIVGGGIAGIMTAWFLQKAGKQVLICEKGRIAGEQSCRNWGFVRQAGRDPAELPIMMDGMSIWQDLQDEIGDDIGFRRPGSLFTSKFPEELAAYENWVNEVGKPNGLDCRMIGAREIDALLNISSETFSAALYTQSDGCAEAFTAVPAIARCLHTKGGVKIRENCAVRMLEVEAGRITGVHTEDGSVRASQVLVAAGLWTGRLLRNHGLHFPQLLVNTTVARTERASSQCQLTFGYSDAAFRPRIDGGYNLTPGEIMEHEICFDTFAFGLEFLSALRRYRKHSSVVAGFYEGFTRRMFPQRRWERQDVTPFERTRVLNPRHSKRHFKRIVKNMRRLFPELADLEIEETWTGAADMTPDILPALGDVSRFPGLYIASGLSGHGFGLGPGVGKAIANHILGNKPQFDLAPFRFERFSDR